MLRVPDDVPVFSMAVAERMTGLTRRRIRYYERNGLVQPARSAGNRRLYSQDDLARLADIKRLLDEGMELRALVTLVASGRWPVAGASPATAGHASTRGLGPSPVPRPGPVAPPRAGGGLEVARFAQYEDARARFLGRGPAGNVDRLYPGDAGRLVRPGPEAAPPGAGRKTPTAAPSVPRATEKAAPGNSQASLGKREG